MATRSGLGLDPGGEGRGLDPGPDAEELQCGGPLMGDGDQADRSQWERKG